MSLARGSTTTQFSKNVSLSLISVFSRYVKQFLHY